MDLYSLAEKSSTDTSAVCIKQFEWLPSSTGVSIKYKKSFTFKQTWRKMIL